MTKAVQRATQMILRGIRETGCSGFYASLSYGIYWKSRRRIEVHP